eukprot:TRINITY_DN4625_c0_g1_i1.p1 TRINITY_DN4625_c0_g1~~TRINITY_DN4625_c0_g1_i1.p1  ORF type:complete len:150 (-),score=13.45 TRINITY_DN4625_c0_g1_i1:298-747(-)
MLGDKTMTPINEEQWALRVFPYLRPGPDVFLTLNVSRYGTSQNGTTIPREATFKDLIKALSDFYMQPLTQEFFDKLKPSNDDYYQHALKEPKGTLCVYQLMGSDEAPLFPILKTGRRHPLLCSGLVRFEGLRYGGDFIVNPVYHVLLGS